MQPFILLSGSPPSDPFRSLKKATRFNMSERRNPVLGRFSMAVPFWLQISKYCRSNHLKDQPGSDRSDRCGAAASSSDSSPLKGTFLNGRGQSVGLVLLAIG